MAEELGLEQEGSAERSLPGSAAGANQLCDWLHSWSSTQEATSHERDAGWPRVGQEPNPGLWGVEELLGIPTASMVEGRCQDFHSSMT